MFLLFFMCPHLKPGLPNSTTTPVSTPSLAQHNLTRHRAPRLQHKACNHSFRVKCQDALFLPAYQGQIICCRIVDILGQDGYTTISTLASVLGSLATPAPTWQPAARSVLGQPRQPPLAQSSSRSRQGNMAPKGRQTYCSLKSQLLRFCHPSI